MKTYKKTKWNSFRLLALGSILACANGYQANAATDPVITWPTLSPIKYSTALSSANVLSASANVPGTYVYRVQATGTQLVSGLKYAELTVGSKVIAVEFTPTDTVNYNRVTNSQTLTVQPKELSLWAQTDISTKPFGTPGPVATSVWLGEQPIDNINIFATTAATNVNAAVGTYSVVPYFEDPQYRATNYTINLINSTFEVTRAQVALYIDPVSSVYGTSNLLVKTLSNTNGYSLVYAPGTVYKIDATNLNFVTRLSTTNDQASYLNSALYSPTEVGDAGTYYYLVTGIYGTTTTAGVTAGQPLTCDISVDGWRVWTNKNYSITIAQVGMLGITTKKLTLTASDQQWPYGNWSSATGTIIGLVTNYYFDDRTNFNITWPTEAQTQKPGTYAINPKITENAWAAGRLVKNYYPIELNSGTLIIQKRQPSVNWYGWATNSGIITYGVNLTANDYLQARATNDLDPAVYTAPQPTIAFRPLTQPLNVGARAIVVDTVETEYYSVKSITNVLTVNPFMPTITWTGADSTNYLQRIAFGTPISSVQLAAKAVGTTNTAGTLPGALTYDALEGDIFEALDTPYSTPHTITASTAATENYLSASRTVSIIVTNGVFDVDNYNQLTTLRATTGNNPVLFKFSGIAKVGSPADAAAGKFPMNGTNYFDQVGLTTTSVITAQLVNTNVSPVKVFTLTNTIAGIGGSIPNADGTFTVAAWVDPTNLFNTFTNGQILPMGTKLELQVSYTNAFYSNGVFSVANATNKYLVEVGKVTPVLTLNSNNTDKTYVYGSTNLISFPISVNFNSGEDININNTNVIVEFNGVTNSFTLKRYVDGAAIYYSNNFQLDITGHEKDYSVYNAGKLVATVKLPTDTNTFNGVTNSINVGFTKRDVVFYAVTNSVGSAKFTTNVVYGEWLDKYSTYSYSNILYAVPQATNYISGLTEWDKAVTATNILPLTKTTWTATPAGGTPYTLQVGSINWSLAGDSKAYLNYNVLRTNGNVIVMRRQLTLEVQDYSAVTNVDATNAILANYLIKNWADAGDGKDYLGIKNNGKIELMASRVLTNSVDSLFYITNRYGTITGVLPSTPDKTAYAQVKILADYSEYGGTYSTYDNSVISSGQYSLYIKGDIGTNYWVTAPVTYGIMTVVGIQPVVTWTPVAMTYGDVFSAANVFNAVAKTNNVADTTEANYTYYAMPNDGSGSDWVQITKTGGSFRIPMATGALKLKVHYKANGNSGFGTNITEATVAVNKAGLYVIIDNVSNPYMSTINPGWGMHISYNGIRNNDPTNGAARAIFARDPATNSANISKFLSCEVTKNTGTTYTNAIGNYEIAPIIDDNGFNAPSNYTVTYVRGNYTITGAEITGTLVSGWDGTDDSTSYFTNTYGWYYSKGDLYNYFHDALTLNPPITNADQLTKITLNDKEYADKALVGAGKYKAIFTYQPADANYAAKTYTNYVDIGKYVISAVVVWDTNKWATLQNARAYRDKVDVFPALWNNPTNFDILVDLTNKLAANISRFVTFDDAQAKSSITNGSVIEKLTNGPGQVTNLWFAVTNETLSTLGIKIVDTSTNTSPSSKTGIGYNISLEATSDSGKANYAFNVLNGTKSLPAYSKFWVTNAAMVIQTPSITRAYGADNPPISLTGVKARKTDGTLYDNLDGFYLQFDTAATASSPAGSVYPINSTIAVQSGGDISKLTYYDVDYVNSVTTGTLTIGKAMLSVNPQAMNWYQRQRAPLDSEYLTDTNSITGFVNGENKSVITSWPVWTSGYTTNAVAGNTFVIGIKTSAAAANYDFTYNPGQVKLTVLAPKTLQAVNDTVTVSASTITKIDVPKLIKNDVPAYPTDTLRLKAAPTVSSNGVAMYVDPNGYWIYYNVNNVSLTPGSVDYFTYSIKDQSGNSSTARVQVKIAKPAATGGIPQNIVKVGHDDLTGSYTLTFLGITGRYYNMQQSTDLITWTSLDVYDLHTTNNYRTNVVYCTNGTVVVKDTDSSVNSSRFWRITSE